MRDCSIVIAVGGTGGHLYPAQSVAKKLLMNHPHLGITFIGGGLSKNAYFKKELFSFLDVPAASISLRKPLRSIKGGWEMARGVLQSIAFLRREKPSCVIGFGSYYSFPALCAASLLNIPIFLHEQNAVAGRVNRFFAKKAEIFGYSIPLVGKKQPHFVPVKMPMTLRDGNEDPYSYFNLDPHAKTILVFGGSRGAKRLNRVIGESAPLFRDQGVQVLHFTGEETSHLEQIYAAHGVRRSIKRFEERMDLAWKAADLAISRAGAGTISESLHYGVPSLLIPYPYAMDDHQNFNADFLVDIVKGGIKLKETELSGERLIKNILKLLEHEAAFKENIILYGNNDSAPDFYQLIEERLYG